MMAEQKRRVRVLGTVATPRGPRYAVKDEGSDEVDLMYPLRNGQPVPMGMEAVHARRLKGDLYECEPIVGRGGMPEVVDATATSSGPPQVATDAYRENWEKIFGSKKRRGPSN